ncbi:MAG TPA: large conductance mechanosensitive channel protein MscL [Bdellovibrionota bacterium]|nr:large conductance mechanosensitive channel protein MscL [Bdellovibrionota bacterium]
MRTPKIKMVDEFKAFVLKHSVVGLAVGVVIGGAVGKLVKALVDDFVMPVVGFLTPSGDWRAIVLSIGNVKFGVGDFLGNFVDFVIVAFVVFMIVKTFIKEAPPPPGPATKQCPQCSESILVSAKKCKFCTSAVG